jgi:hypothetical protein
MNKQKGKRMQCSYATPELTRMNLGKEIELEDALSSYRIHENTTPSDTQLKGNAFGTFQGHSDNPATPKKSRNSRSQPLECVCGKRHWYKDCWHINQVARSLSFKSSPEILERIQEAAKTNLRLAKALENGRETSS